MPRPKKSLQSDLGFLKGRGQNLVRDLFGIEEALTITCIMKTKKRQKGLHGLKS